ncbi:MAG: hypothetical protein J6B01_08555 [Ruminococcus sp.]|nr:hypothetical protein [Ruminococcus sp.]
MKNKKIAASAGCILACTALTVGSVSSAQRTTDDLVHLRNALLREGEMTKADDIDGDGVVDVFDMVQLRQQLAQTGEQNLGDFAAVAKNVKLVGRTLRDGDITWLVQSGSAVKFTVSASEATVTLAGDNSISNGADHRSRYAILVDGEVIEDDVMSEETKDITIFSGNAMKTAEITVIHLSEANNGAIGVKNINVKSSAAKPVVPVPEKEIKIEFIGDSITCAYGVEGLSSGESFKTTTENFMKSYAYLTAELLDADYSAVSYSGHGIISGYTSGEKNTDQLVPDFYENVGKWQYAKPWDFASVENDVVVINLGTNDNSYLQNKPEGGDADFIAGYVDFLGMVRKCNPDAHIICTMGTMGGNDVVYPLIEEAVKQFGDKKVTCYESVTQNIQMDGVGSDWHPSAVTQQNSAYVLADKICQALGIESSQIGLDVAVDSEYKLVTDPDLGGNCYAYLNDYDKSFWLTNYAGGSAPEALEAVIAPVGLKKDGVYQLKFDWTAGAESEVPLIVRSGGKVIYEDTISCGAETIHYEKEFTCPEACDAEVVFQIGGYDSGRFTIQNFKLVKTK